MRAFRKLPVTLEVGGQVRWQGAFPRAFSFPRQGQAPRGRVLAKIYQSDL